MPEWLRPVVVETPIGVAGVAVRLGVSLVLGVVVALIYRASHGRESRDARTLTATLVLLTILIAMVTMVIGESVARAFGLVGALSIVRFRTIVEDTRDTAFVIFAVIVGMAVGTGLMYVALVGIPIVALAAFMLSRERGQARTREPLAAAGALFDHTIVVRVSLAADPGALVEPLLKRHARAHRLSQTATARQGAALDLTYLVDLGPAGSLVALVSELNRLEGVISAEGRTN